MEYRSETMKQWKIWAAVQAALICCLELVFFGHGFEEVLLAFAFSIPCILVGAFLSGYIINGLIFSALLDRPIDWGNIILIGLFCSPITGIALFFFFGTVYKIFTGDYTEFTDTGPYSAVLATAPLYCKLSNETYKQSKEI